MYSRQAGAANLLILDILSGVKVTPDLKTRVVHIPKVESGCSRCPEEGLYEA